jgi:hypothetical protein
VTSKSDLSCCNTSHQAAACDNDIAIIDSSGVTIALELCHFLSLVRLRVALMLGIVGVNESSSGIAYCFCMFECLKCSRSHSHFAIEHNKDLLRESSGE